MRSNIMAIEFYCSDEAIEKVKEEMDELREISHKLNTLTWEVESKYMLNENGLGLALEHARYIAQRIEFMTKLIHREKNQKEDNYNE